MVLLLALTIAAEADGTALRSLAASAGFQSVSEVMQVDADGVPVLPEVTEAAAPETTHRAHPHGTGQIVDAPPQPVTAVKEPSPEEDDSEDSDGDENALILLAVLLPLAIGVFTLGPGNAARRRRLRQRLRQLRDH